MVDGEPRVRAEEPPKQKDKDASNESKSIDREDLAIVGRRQEHKRSERIRNVFGWGTVVLLVLGFVIIGTSLLSVAAHYLLPDCCHWMGDEELDAITTVLFSGGLYAFLGLYVRDRIAR